MRILTATVYSLGNSSTRHMFDVHHSRLWPPGVVEYPIIPTQGPASMACLQRLPCPWSIHDPPLHTPESGGLQSLQVLLEATDGPRLAVRGPEVQVKNAPRAVNVFGPLDYRVRGGEVVAHHSSGVLLSQLTEGRIQGCGPSLASLYPIILSLGRTPTVLKSCVVRHSSRFYL